MRRVQILIAAALLCSTAQAIYAQPPGVLVDRSPDFQKVYVGCPSIAILPDGGYVASHSWFGPGTNNDATEIFGSADRGRTWHKLAALQGQWWSTLFVHRGTLYIIGVSRQYGDIVIRRSSDGGRTWTAPKDGQSGRLCAGKYHCAPVPVIIHKGRIWRAFELAEGKRPAWSALVLSAPENADLLDAAQWRMSEKLQHLWSNSQWIEGNMVVAPDETLVNVLRTSSGPDRAALVHVSDDGTRLSHDRATDLITMPGGGSKFTIRFDPQTRRYWTIGNKQSDPPAGRNVLALASSADLRTWKVETILLQHADSQYHAWQYVDWVFDAEDFVAVSRTAWDGSHNYHDANYLTFHRFVNFRSRAQAVSAPVMQQAAHGETAAKPLWVGSVDLSKNANIPFLDAEHRVIDECTAGEYQFTIGADIVFHDGQFIAQWANSRQDENDEHSLVRARRSRDGKTWSGREVIAPGFEGKGFHSQGVFFSNEGRLWSFNAQIQRQPQLKGYYPGLCTDAFLWKPAIKQWEPQATTGLEGFWPLCKPIRLGNGQWIMAGARNAPKTVLAAVAICDGSDFTRWRLVTIPHPADLEPNQIWGETTVTVEGSHVLALVRNGKKGGTGFWISISCDHGQTWPELRESNIPPGGGRPVLGRLTDGRHFLVSNMRTRNTLVLALTKPGTLQFDRMYRLIDRPSPPVRMPGGAKRVQWAYPSAIEHDGKLYIVYSITKEATGLTVVDLAATRCK